VPADRCFAAAPQVRETSQARDPDDALRTGRTVRPGGNAIPRSIDANSWGRHVATDGGHNGGVARPTLLSEGNGGAPRTTKRVRRRWELTTEVRIAILQRIGHEARDGLQLRSGNGRANSSCWPFGDSAETRTICRAPGATRLGISAGPCRGLASVQRRSRGLE
jgi:hypothetical protein